MFQPDYGLARQYGGFCSRLEIVIGEQWWLRTGWAVTTLDGRTTIWCREPLDVLPCLASALPILFRQLFN